MEKSIYLFANWKMYLDYDESNILANSFADTFDKSQEKIKIGVFPSALSLYTVGQVLHDVGIGIGSQNAYWIDKGGYTGEHSMQMFKLAGCDYALIGHSERRHIFHESNHDVRQKIEAALVAGLIPVVCVGETLDERKANKAEEVVEVQLRAAFNDLSISEGATIFIAYEPVWAIGTGEACNAVDAEKMHIRVMDIATTLLSGINIKILYGGSVKGDNVSDYFKNKNTDGVLVGNASTKLDSFKDIYDKTIEFLAN